MVLCVCYVPQIGNAIVGTIAIDVIDIVLRPFAIMQSKCYAMRPVQTSKYGPVKVSFRIDVSECRSIRPLGVPRAGAGRAIEKMRPACAPSKGASFCIVMQKLRQGVRRDAGVGRHAAPVAWWSGLWTRSM